MTSQKISSKIKTGLVGLLLTPLLMGSLKANEPFQEKTNDKENIQVVVDEKELLNEKEQLYIQKIEEAQQLYGTRYMIKTEITGENDYLGQLVNTGVYLKEVRDDNMRTESFVICLNPHFLLDQPEILFEHSTQHELAHITEDDLTTYRRNGSNVELVQEHVILKKVGIEKYRDYIEKYNEYQPLGMGIDAFIQQVKEATPKPAPNEIEEADILVAKYFLEHKSDGLERAVLYGGEIIDVSLDSRKGSVGYDYKHIYEHLNELPESIIFYHNHPGDNIVQMYPSNYDIGSAGKLETFLYRFRPNISIKHRVINFSEGKINVTSYGFKGPFVKEIKDRAIDYNKKLDGLKEKNENITNSFDIQTKRKIIDMQEEVWRYNLTSECYDKYLKHVTNYSKMHKDPNSCKVHPQFFLWPSEKFYLHYNGFIEESELNLKE